MPRADHSEIVFSVTIEHLLNDAANSQCRQQVASQYHESIFRYMKIVIISCRLVLNTQRLALRSGCQRSQRNPFSSHCPEQQHTYGVDGQDE